MTGETITIVGGGPSGMTLAWWLVEQGIPVTLLEREPEVPHDMRASTFHPATLDLLAPSGLSHELLARGTEVSRWQYLIHATGETAIFDMACLADVTEFPFRFSVNSSSSPSYSRNDSVNIRSAIFDLVLSLSTVIRTPPVSMLVSSIRDARRLSDVTGYSPPTVQKVVSERR